MPEGIAFTDMAFLHFFKIMKIGITESEISQSSEKLVSK